MTKKHFEFAARMIRENRFRASERRLLVDAFVVVFREFNPRFDESRFRAAAGDATDGTDEPRVAVGTCPACREPVFADEPDGPVWTCPADLSDTNPCHEPPLVERTDEERERSGFFGNCCEDSGDNGGQCYDRLPLHSACYERGNY